MFLYFVKLCLLAFIYNKKHRAISLDDDSNNGMPTNDNSNNNMPNDNNSNNDEPTEDNSNNDLLAHPSTCRFIGTHGVSCNVTRYKYRAYAQSLYW